MEIVIAKFIQDDQHDLEKLYLESRLETFTWRKTSIFQLDDFLIDTRGEEIFVAKDKNQIVGFISLDAKKSFIHHLYVHPNLKRQGIGLCLLNYAVEIYPSPLRLKCLVKNKNALDFYKTNGWQIESLTQDDSDLGDYYNYIYFKG